MSTPGVPTRAVPPRLAVVTGRDLLGFRCTACGACCRTHVVPVTHVDVARLDAALGPAADAALCWLDPADTDLTGEPETLFALPEGWRLLALARDRDGCVLLDAGGRCTVHAARPTSCRAYPFDVEVRPEGVAVSFLTSVVRRHELDGPSREADVLRTSERLRAELAEFAGLVARWNLTQRRRRVLGRARAGRNEALAWLRRRGRAGAQP